MLEHDDQLLYLDISGQLTANEVYVFSLAVKQSKAKEV